MRFDTPVPTTATLLATFHFPGELEFEPVQVYGLHEQDDAHAAEDEFTYYHLVRDDRVLTAEPLSSFPTWQDAKRLLAS